MPGPISSGFKTFFSKNDSTISPSKSLYDLSGVRNKILEPPVTDVGNFLRKLPDNSYKEFLVDVSKMEEKVHDRALAKKLVNLTNEERTNHTLAEVGKNTFQKYMDEMRREGHDVKGLLALNAKNDDFVNRVFVQLKSTGRHNDADKFLKIVIKNQNKFSGYSSDFKEILQNKMPGVLEVFNSTNSADRIRYAINKITELSNNLVRSNEDHHGVRCLVNAALIERLVEGAEHTTDKEMLLTRLEYFLVSAEKSSDNTRAGAIDSAPLTKEPEAIIQGGGKGKDGQPISITVSPVITSNPHNYFNPKDGGFVNSENKSNTDNSNPQTGELQNGNNVIGSGASKFKEAPPFIPKDKHEDIDESLSYQGGKDKLHDSRIRKLSGYNRQDSQQDFLNEMKKILESFRENVTNAGPDYKNGPDLTKVEDKTKKSGVDNRPSNTELGDIESVEVETPDEQQGATSSEKARIENACKYLNVQQIAKILHDNNVRDGMQFTGINLVISPYLITHTTERFQNENLNYNSGNKKTGSSDWVRMQEYLEVLSQNDEALYKKIVNAMEDLNADNEASAEAKKKNEKFIFKGVN